jgi:hypothetical protein
MWVLVVFVLVCLAGGPVNPARADPARPASLGRGDQVSIPESPRLSNAIRRSRGAGSLLHLAAVEEPTAGRVTVATEVPWDAPARYLVVFLLVLFNFFLVLFAYFLWRSTSDVWRAVQEQSRSLHRSIEVAEWSVNTAAMGVEAAKESAAASTVGADALMRTADAAARSARAAESALIAVERLLEKQRLES